jgi:fumarate hydratase subunit beta
MTRRVSFPCSAREIGAWKAYDRLYIDGKLLVGRDQVHKRLVALLASQEALPVDLTHQGLYYMGPAATPASLAIGSCGPTTSARMDPFTVALMDAGLMVTIGKGPRSEAVTEAIRHLGGAYLVAFGGCGALYATKVISQRVVAFGDLGPEALYEIEVRDFPVIVGIDAHGNSVFP